LIAEVFSNLTPSTEFLRGPWLFARLFAGLFLYYSQPSMALTLLGHRRCAPMLKIAPSIF
jgi:hypothetical protein